MTLLSLSMAAALVCSNLPPPQNDAKTQEAKAFVKKVEADLLRLGTRAQTAAWVANTYITDDTERNSASMAEDLSSYIAKAIKESQQYRGLKLDPDTARQLMLLRYASSLPAPADPAKASELASLAAKLEGMYGKGKWCGEGYKEGVNLAEDKKNCRDLQQLSAVLEAAGQAKAPSPAAQLEAWAAWHKTTSDMRPLYERLISLANEGSKEIGADDLGHLWRSSYEMPPADLPLIPVLRDLLS